MNIRGLLRGACMIVGALTSGCCTMSLWVYDQPGAGFMKPELLEGGRARWTSNGVLEVEYNATWPKKPWWFHTAGKTVVRARRSVLEAAPADPMLRPTGYPRLHDTYRTPDDSLPFIVVYPDVHAGNAPFPDYECILVGMRGSDNLVTRNRTAKDREALARNWSWSADALTWYRPASSNAPGRRVTLVEAHTVKPLTFYLVAGALTPAALIADVVTFPLQCYAAHRMRFYLP